MHFQVTLSEFSGEKQSETLNHILQIQEMSQLHKSRRIHVRYSISTVNIPYMDAMGIKHASTFSLNLLLV